MLLTAGSLLANGAGLPALQHVLPTLLCRGIRTVPSSLPTTSAAAAERTRRYADKAKDPAPGTQWHWMVSQGHKVGSWGAQYTRHATSKKNACMGGCPHKQRMSKLAESWVCS